MIFALAFVGGGLLGLTMLFGYLWRAERSARRRWQDSARLMARQHARACDRADDWPQ